MNNSTAIHNLHQAADEERKHRRQWDRATENHLRQLDARIAKIGRQWERENERGATWPQSV